ncbi:SelT-like protein [Vitis vinifera]|uniref:SelT-like protein n=1 Tax=Vitis vinifera TaxID=29760 RepID=A0A438HKJ2_VITVI|nr:SelT-like protein [Vitis vinifera]
MDRAQLLLVGLPLFLFFSDIINLFTPPPPKPPPHHHHQQPQPKPQSAPLDFPTQKESGIGGIGFGNTVNINFCSSCSYRTREFSQFGGCKLFCSLYEPGHKAPEAQRSLIFRHVPDLDQRLCGGNAVTMKNMLESQFPGVTVVLANYPPPLPKRLLSKVVPVVQIGVIGIVMAGEQIFPRLGFIAPPPWYYSLRANRFGTISTTWLLGNFLQSFLQSSGAFEVYCNGELVFSKLKQQRFPGEIELKDLVGQRLVASRIVDDVGAGVWSQPL